MRLWAVRLRCWALSANLLLSIAVHDLPFVYNAKYLHGDLDTKTVVKMGCTLTDKL